MSRRADNAQKNGFEAFPFFAAAVIVAHLLHAPQERVDILAIIFIVARIGYSSATSPIGRRCDRWCGSSASSPA